MNLLLWILLGFVINTILLRDELNQNHESLLSSMVIIGMRSVSGGMFSNFLFQDGLGSLGISTFFMAGVVPVLIILAAKLYKFPTPERAAESPGLALR